MSSCRSCGAEVVWVVATNRKMPLDAVPDPERGNVALLNGGHGLVLDAAEAVERRARGDRLYVSHFATCPDARDWRKK